MGDDLCIYMYPMVLERRQYVRILYPYSLEVYLNLIIDEIKMEFY